MKKVLIFLLMFVTYLNVYAEISLKFAPQEANFNYFYVSYIDPNDVSQQPFLFNLKATNNGDEDVIGYEIYVNFSWNGVSLIENAVVTPKEEGSYYTIPSNGFKEINNKELLMSGETQNFSSDFDFDFDTLGGDTNFKDYVLDLTYFPDGEYRIDVEMLYSGGLSATASYIFTVSAPSPVTLISPGNSKGMGEVVISDLNPYFVWFSNQQEFSLRLYEIEDEFQTVEEIELNLEPIFKEDDITMTILAYPPSAKPLKYGTLYAWQIETDVATALSKSNNSVKSDMYFFRIKESQSADSGYALTINLLMQLDNEDMHKLADFLQSGFNINFMNSGNDELNIADLNKLLIDFNNGNFKIQEVEIK